MTDLVDTFTGSGTLLAHTSDSGHSWADAPNTFFGSEGGSLSVLNSGSLRVTQPGGIDDYHYFAASCNYGDTDGYIEAVLNFPSGVTPPGIASYQFYMGMRFNDNWDGIIAALLVWPTPFTTMLGRLTDGYSQIANTSGVAIANPITFRLELNDTAATVFVNGVSIMAATTGPAVSGKSIIMLQQPKTGPLMTVDSLASIQTPPVGDFWQDFLQTVEA